MAQSSVLKFAAGEFDVSRTAVVAVDLQKECVAKNGAWPIHNAQQVLTNAQKVIAASRDAGLPIIYTKQWLDPHGADAQRYEKLGVDNRPFRSVAGSPMAEICDEVAPRESDPIVHKQRWSAFFNSNLELILNKRDIRHLIMFGVWTEACFETTVWDAIWRDYRISIVKDACGTASPLMHMTAILDLANWLYGGMVFSSDELVKAIRKEPFHAWKFEEACSFVYTLDNVEQLYRSL